jgi:uncharacterized protein (DUF433 family)
MIARIREVYKGPSEVGGPFYFRVTCLNTRSGLSFNTVTAEQKASLAAVVSVSREIMHGTPCFAGTRVPVQTLLDYIEEGDTLDSFLRDFSTVTRAQAIDFLELAKTQLIECVSS